MHFAAHKTCLYHVSSPINTGKIDNISSLMRLFSNSKSHLLGKVWDPWTLWVTLVHLDSAKDILFGSGSETSLEIPKRMNHRQVLSICNFHVALITRSPFVFNNVEDQNSGEISMEKHYKGV